MSEARHPEAHVNEEPRNDFLDVAVGFFGVFGIMLVVCTAATLIAFWMQ